MCPENLIGTERILLSGRSEVAFSFKRAKYLSTPEKEPKKMTLLGFIFLGALVGAALLAIGVIIGAAITRLERRCK